MRNLLHYLVLHCTATPEFRAVTKEDVIKWHTSPVSQGGRGWTRPGYRDLIYLEGQLVNLVPFNTDDYVDPSEISNGAIGLNGIAGHVAYVGGMDQQNKLPKDTRTKGQLYTLEVYVKYTVMRHPLIEVLGHYQAPHAQGKACPSFNVPEWLRSIHIPELNIYSGPASNPVAMNTPTTPEVEA